MRNYIQKNRYCPNTKLSDDEFIAVLTCYIRGMTASHASVLLARWSRRRGSREISRQCIQDRYKSSGEKLWMLSFEYRYERKPSTADRPEDDLKVFRDAVYTPLRVSEIEQVKRQSRLLQRMKLNPVTVANDEVSNRLRALSAKMRGLPADTFYIHWARIYWLVQIEDRLQCSAREAQDELLEQLLDTYQNPPEYGEVIDQEERFEYFKYGTVLARIHRDRQNNPDRAERYCYDTGEFVLDHEVLDEVYLIGTDGLWEVSKSQFDKLLKLAKISPEEIRRWRPDGNRRRSKQA
ncbi:MAG: hypothetical protein KC449_13620 [Anaerolineales bacterium]|nr:hypothetical protein [Anaerolineales bacterium]